MWRNIAMTIQNAKPVSRRQFLKVSVAGAASTAALAGCATLGLPRVSKAYAGYEEHAAGKRHCHDCVHFQAPSGCTVVSGTINKDGVCNYFLAEK
jgi:anaerobic selenocysteine-containing dehydrogenase